MAATQTNCAARRTSPRRLRGPQAPALPFNGQLLLTARINPSPQQFTAAVNLELFTFK